MIQSPYVSPAEVENPAKQRFPWKWMFAAGVLTAVTGYLSMVALILSNETPTGVGGSPTVVIPIAFLCAGIMMLGAIATVIGGVGWLISWFRR